MLWGIGDVCPDMGRECSSHQGISALVRPGVLIKHHLWFPAASSEPPRLPDRKQKLEPEEEMRFSQNLRDFFSETT